MTPPPHDRPILVLTREAVAWLPVRWNERSGRFKVEGRPSWVTSEEVEDWRPLPWPAIGIGQPERS